MAWNEVCLTEYIYWNADFQSVGTPDSSGILTVKIAYNLYRLKPACQPHKCSVPLQIRSYVHNAFHSIAKSGFIMSILNATLENRFSSPFSRQPYFQILRKLNI